MRTVNLPVEPFSAEAFAPFGVAIGEPARAPDMAWVVAGFILAREREPVLAPS